MAVSFIIVCIALVGVLFWCRSRSLDWRLRQLQFQLDQLQPRKKRAPATVSKLLHNIYSLLNASLQAKQANITYQTVELVKQAYGANIIREHELFYLTGAVVAAIKGGQSEAAAPLLDVFRLMARQLNFQKLPVAAEQLVIIHLVAVRNKTGYLAAKSSEILLLVIEQAMDGPNRPDTDTLIVDENLLRALRIMGLLTLRRGDDDLFREIASRLGAILLKKKLNYDPMILATFLIDWLHRIVQKNNVQAFAVLANFSGRIFTADLLIKEQIQYILTEWLRLAGTASLNPQSPLAPIIIEQALNFAVNIYDGKLWANVVHEATQVGKLSISRNELREAFVVLHPLLDAGRRLLIAELKFGSCNHEGFRSGALHLVVKQCLILAEFAARQQLLATTGDYLIYFYQNWLLQPSSRLNQKSIKKFCQLLLFCWLNSGKKQARKYDAGSELDNPRLISQAEIQRLGFNVR